MSKKLISIIAAVLVVVAVSIIAYGFITKQNNEKADTNSTSLITEVKPDTSSMMYQQYANLTGDEYDKRFIDDMIAHHQGAVQMADLALQNANRQEIKDMSREIIAAQAKEITDMERWQQEWGYPVLDHSTMDHSSDGAMGMDMSMGDHMGMMMEELKDKKGDEFDRVFLEQMIIHHQGALDMAATGETNAKHQELKDLTKAVVEAQSKEIKQMKQWQQDWGYDK